MKLPLLMLSIFFICQNTYSQSEDGPFKKYFDNGTPQTEGQYLNNKRVGEWKNYYENGQLKSVVKYDKEGNRDKSYLSYYEDGTLQNKTQLEDKNYISRGYYKSGELYFERIPESGYYKEYRKDGTLKIEANYLNYQLYGTWKSFYENGKVNWEVAYFEGYRNGGYKNYDNTGNLKLEGIMIKDKKLGEEKRYYDNGELEWKGSYYNDKLDKTWTRYDLSGKKIEKVRFKRGETSSSPEAKSLQPTSVPDGVIEKVPVYPGCEDVAGNKFKKNCMSSALSGFVNNNFNTNVVKGKDLHGVQKINVIFKINKEGNVEDISAKGPHPVLEEEAIRVIRNLPKLEPGYQRGKPVIVPYALPIIFQVK